MKKLFSLLLILALLISAAAAVAEGAVNPNLLAHTKPMQTEYLTVDSGKSEMMGSVAMVDGGLKIVNVGSNTRVLMPRINVTPGETYTLSVKYRALSGDCSKLNLLLAASDGTNYEYISTLSEGVGQTADAGDGWTLLSATYTMPEGKNRLSMNIRSGAEDGVYHNAFLLREPKMELGTAATAWVPMEGETMVFIRPNLLDHSKPLVLSRHWTDSSGADVKGSASAKKDGSMHIVNVESNTRVWLGNFPVTAGETYTVSFKYRPVSGNTADVDMQVICFTDGKSNGSFRSSIDNGRNEETLPNGYIWHWGSFTAPEGTDAVVLTIHTGKDYKLYTNDLYIKEPKMEVGSEVSAWVY